MYRLSWEVTYDREARPEKGLGGLWCPRCRAFCGGSGFRGHHGVAWGRRLFRPSLPQLQRALSASAVPAGRKGCVGHPVRQFRGDLDPDPGGRVPQCAGMGVSRGTPARGQQRQSRQGQSDVLSHAGSSVPVCALITATHARTAARRLERNDRLWCNTRSDTMSWDERWGFVQGDKRQIQTAVLGSADSEEPLMLPLEAIELDAFRRRHEHDTFWCGLLRRPADDQALHRPGVFPVKFYVLSCGRVQCQIAGWRGSARCLR